MGGIPTNYHGEVVTLKDGNPDTRRARPVRGRRGGLRLGPRRQPPGLEQPDRPRRVRPRRPAFGSARCSSRNALQKPLPKDAGELALTRLDHFRHAEGGSPTAADPRSTCSATMQADCAVFRTERTLAEGVAKIDAGLSSAWPTSRVTDRSLIWNTDLDRDARARQSHRPGGGDHALRRQPQGKPRRAHARGLSQARRQELDEAHRRLVRRLGRQGRRRARSITARSTNITLTDEIEYIKPKARVY